MRYDQAFKVNGYHTALLTTFDFDPTVFENVVLVAMRSRGCRNIAVLADRSMVNRAFTELASAPRAGIAYHLAKRSVRGAFHPKMVLQLGQFGGRLMVGSANLTGGGLVGNLETVSILEVSDEDQSAAPLLAAAFRYFEAHTDTADPAMREILARARGMTSWLTNTQPRDEVVIGGERVTLLVEGEDAGVGELFRNFVGDDVIHRLIIVSPYADATLEGFASLRTLFGMPPTAFIVDAKGQDFTAETFAAQAAASLHSSTVHKWGGKRPLHAKLVVACGGRADYVLAGSANASLAGLFSRFNGRGNAEACLARSEPVGTAIERLQLDDCLATPMPLSSLKPRLHAREEVEAGPTVPRDAGNFWIEHGFLFWHPPVGCIPESCHVQVTDGSGRALAVELPKPEGDRWAIPLLPDIDVGTCRGAVVYFQDGSKSAPSNIAALNQLQRNASPPIKGAASRILEELEGRDDVDDEDYERALKLLALLRSDVTKQRDVTQTTSTKEEDEAGKVLPEDQFGEIANTSEGRIGLKTGPISEMRRLVNAFLGLGNLNTDDKDDLDPLGAHIKNANTVDRGSPPEDIDNEGGDRDQKTDRETLGKTGKGPARVKESMAVANSRADKLVGHVEETCRALARPNLDPLNLEIAIRIHLLINVFLSRCAPVGEKPSVCRPILAGLLPVSWTAG